MVLVLACGACSSSDDSATLDTPTTVATIEPSPTTSRAPAPTTIAPTTTVIVASAPPLPSEALGDIEVSMLTRVPRLDVEWTTTWLEQPDGNPVSLVYTRLAGGEYVVVGVASAPPARQQIYTWRSTDGETWTRSEAALPAGLWLHTMFSWDDGIGAIGDRIDDRQPMLWHAGTDGTWEPVDFGSLDLTDV
ncbi:MAG: hypothetical protein QNJ12_21670, partial [Ilumatobacter sp.]